MGKVEWQPTLLDELVRMKVRWPWSAAAVRQCAQHSGRNWLVWMDAEGKRVRCPSVPVAATHYTATDWTTALVTKEQYERALL